MRRYAEFSNRRFNGLTKCCPKAFIITHQVRDSVLTLLQTFYNILIRPFWQSDWYANLNPHTDVSLVKVVP